MDIGVEARVGAFVSDCAADVRRLKQGRLFCAHEERRQNQGPSIGCSIGLRNIPK